VRRLIVLLLMAAGAACASMQFPPGGPPDKTTPKLLSTIPETNAVNVHVNHIVFQFDKVMNETPSGSGGGAASSGSGLEGLFLVSPWDGSPKVDWHRSHITVTSRKKMRPNTVYTVIMLPGMSDLRGNVMKTGATLVFSTGPTIPTTVVRGQLFDWVTGKPAPHALVEGIVRPDSTSKDTSTIYITVADTNGRFALAHMPPGRYTIRGWIDANSNRKLDIRELWDSTGITLQDSATVELLAFVHDTVGPRVADVKIADSVTLRLTFDKGLDPAQKIAASMFTLHGKDSVKAKDSTTIQVVSATPAHLFDSTHTARIKVHEDSLARIDSLRRADSGVVGRDTLAVRRRSAERAARRDSIARAKLGTPSKPSPTIEVVLVLGQPLVPGAAYHLTATDIRSILGRSRTSTFALTVPKAVVAGKDSTGADSTRGRRPTRGSGPPPPARP
jgi:hypothetical protein